jgi:hypothetical protein
MRFAMRSATAEATATSRAVVTPERVIVVAKGADYEVKLIHIPPGTSPEYRPESTADILCLSLHEFSLPEAIAWVRASVANSQGVLPCIAVLGSADKLSREDLWQISRELEPAGAIFHRWPERCRSFDEAFRSLGDEIAKTYGHFPAFCEEHA